jgi:hypothetical protein
MRDRGPALPRIDTPVGVRSQDVSGSQRLMGAVQQSPEESRRFRRSGGFDCLGFGLFLGQTVTLFGRKPFFQAQASFGSAPGFIGTLTLGHFFRFRHTLTPAGCPAG